MPTDIKFPTKDLPSDLGLAPGVCRDNIEQRTPEWLALRAEQDTTGSNLGQVAGCAKTSAISKVEGMRIERATPTPPDQRWVNELMERGTGGEQFIAEAVTGWLKSAYDWPEFTFRDGGFWLVEAPFTSVVQLKLGISPDGVADAPFPAEDGRQEALAFEFKWCAAPYKDIVLTSRDGRKHGIKLEHLVQCTFHMLAMDRHQGKVCRRCIYVAVDAKVRDASAIVVPFHAGFARAVLSRLKRAKAWMNMSDQAFAALKQRMGANKDQFPFDVRAELVPHLQCLEDLAPHAGKVADYLAPTEVFERAIARYRARAHDAELDRPLPAHIWDVVCREARALNASGVVSAIDNSVGLCQARTDLMTRRLSDAEAVDILCAADLSARTQIRVVAGAKGVQVKLPCVECGVHIRAESTCSKCRRVVCEKCWMCEECKEEEPSTKRARTS